MTRARQAVPLLYADKLDILRVFKDQFFCESNNRNAVIFLDLPEGKTISRPVMESILNHEMVSYFTIRNQNDFALMRASCASLKKD